MPLKYNPLTGKLDLVSAPYDATTDTIHLLKASNLSDLSSISTARTNLGLGNVDNTSDVNKPVSTAQAAADSLRFLKSGDTMGGNIAMGANKITGLANGTASTDAAAFGQLPTTLPPNGTAGGDLSGSYPNPTVAKIHGVAYNADPLTQYVALAPGSSARNVIQPTGASIIPSIIKGALSQSADLHQWQDSTGVVLARLTANGDISFDGNRDYTISVGASGNPFPNADRNLILRPQFYGSLKIQSGVDPTYGININPIAGGITFDKNPGFATVLDVPNGNGFNYIRIGTAEIYISVNSFVFRTRGASTENITLNLGVITSGQISLDVLTTGATGTATSGVTSYKSFSNSLIGSYWDGAAAQRIIGSQYIDAAAKQYRIAVLDTGVDPNQTTGSNVYGFDTSGNFIWANLSASSITAGLVVENLSSGNPPLTVNKKANSSTGGMEWYSGGGSPALVASLDGAGRFSSLHLIGNGTAPSIAAGAGAGTSPTVSLTGHDTAGKISVTTGTLPTLSADVFTVTFNTGYASAPYVNFSPANAVTALLSGASMVYVTATTTTFKFTAGTTPLTAATTYLWNYSVVG